MVKDIWKIYQSKYSREKCKMFMKQKTDIKTKLLFLILAVIEVHRF